MAGAREIHTARLRLVPLTAGDIDAIHELWTEPEVRRFLWDGIVIPRDQTSAIIDTNRRYFASHGYGLWGARLPDRSELIGFAGYWFFHDPPERQILYGLAPAYWGLGLAVEMARAVIRYGFEVLQFAEVVGSTDVPNTASCKVMERAGMQFQKRALVNQLDTVYYMIRREDYEIDDAPFEMRPVV